MKTLFAALLSLVLSLSVSLPAPALADGMKVGNLMIEDVWVRTTLRTGAPTGAFMLIKNMGSAPDRLIAASSPRAKATEIHQSSMAGGVMKMRRVDGVEVPANGMAMLKPGSYHVMMMGVTHAIKAGSHIPLTLTFEHAGKITLNVEARAMGNMPPKHDMKTHDMKKKSD